MLDEEKTPQVQQLLEAHQELCRSIKMAPNYAQVERALREIEKVFPAPEPVVVTTAFHGVG